MDLESLVADFHAFEELLLDVGHAGGSEQRRQHVFMGEDVVVDGAGLDYAGPADGRGDTIAALPVRVLLSAEGRGAAIRPTGDLRTVVGGVHDDGVLVEAELFELVEG